MCTCNYIYIHTLYGMFNPDIQQNYSTRILKKKLQWSVIFLFLLLSSVVKCIGIFFSYHTRKRYYRLSPKLNPAAYFTQFAQYTECLSPGTMKVVSSHMTSKQEN